VATALIRIGGVFVIANNEERPTTHNSDLHKIQACGRVMVLSICLITWSGWSTIQ